MSQPPTPNPKEGRFLLFDVVSTWSSGAQVTDVYLTKKLAGLRAAELREQGAKEVQISERIIQLDPDPDGF